MISREENSLILEKAYIPEHIPGLMEIVSGGEPFLSDEYIFFRKNSWLIFIGYPLDSVFSPAKLVLAIRRSIDRFKPEFFWLVAPDPPGDFQNNMDVEQVLTPEKEDMYFKLHVPPPGMGQSLPRHLEKASESVTVGISRELTEEHELLISQFLQEDGFADTARGLYLHMSQYMEKNDSGIFVNAWDKNGKLAAFFVIETAANNFLAYMEGCRSKVNHVPHASDLLFFEIIKMAQAQKKMYINLGIGVNDDIRRFKKKWGGAPCLKYQFREIKTGYKKTTPIFNSLESLLYSV